MKIALIKPRYSDYKTEVYYEDAKMEPLSLAVIAGLTPSEHEVVLYDDRIEPIPYNEPIDLAGISIEIYNARRGYEIADEYRKRHVPVILGGFHPSLAPDEAIEHADAVVIGEVEGLWGKILHDAESRRLQKFYRSNERPLLKGVFPNRLLYKNKKYLPITLVEFGRGCKHSCEFCAISSFFRNSYIHRPVEEVVEEIKSLRQRRIIFFVDDNITADIDAAKKLLRAITPLKVHWVGQASVDLADDDELLSLLSKSGCMGLVIGFESLDKDNLIQMKKGWEVKFNMCEKVLKKLRESGIAIWASFLFGYDNDDEIIFKEILNFSVKNKFAFLATNNLMPYPGTPLYTRLLKEDRMINKKWWLDPEYKFGYPPYKLKSMAGKELAEGCNNLRRTFYSFSSIIKRCLGAQVNCKNVYNFSIFFKYNLLFRKEVLRRLKRL